MEIQRTRKKNNVKKISDFFFKQYYAEELSDWQGLKNNFGCQDITDFLTRIFDLQIINLNT